MMRTADHQLDVKILEWAGWILWQNEGLNDRLLQVISLFECWHPVLGHGCDRCVFQQIPSECHSRCFTVGAE